MKVYKEQRFTGERALFQSADIVADYCTFADGESHLKEGMNLKIFHSSFQWRYPLWYCDQVEVSDCTFKEEARAGIWYTNHLTMRNTSMEAPKSIRRCEHLILENVEMLNAQETLWNCKSIKMSNVTVKGEYFAMGSSDVTIDGFTLVGQYCFDNCKNVIIRNARMLTKDAFWNCENITVYDSYISSQYFGWNSKNVTLVNCTIESEQGMCYMENLTMKNCKLLNTNLAFEYSTVDATIDSKIDSVKNPISGKIVADEIGEIIFDDPKIDKNKTKIMVMR
ncbi:MAG: DUF3737 family protein [Clostridiales bacterium]|nr:DUF3737 family protein [Clostridiales bacterium]